MAMTEQKRQRHTASLPKCAGCGQIALRGDIYCGSCRQAETERELAEQETQEQEQEKQALLDRVEALEKRARVTDKALRQIKARLERGWPEAAIREIDRTLAYPADNEPTEHRATLAVIPAYDGWLVTKDSRVVSGPHCSEVAAVEAMRKIAGKT